MNRRAALFVIGLGGCERFAEAESIEEWVSAGTLEICDLSYQLREVPWDEPTDGWPVPSEAVDELGDLDVGGSVTRAPTLQPIGQNVEPIEVGREQIQVEGAPMAQVEVTQRGTAGQVRAIEPRERAEQLFLERFEGAVPTRRGHAPSTAR